MPPATAPPDSREIENLLPLFASVLKLLLLLLIDDAERDLRRSECCLSELSDLLLLLGFEDVEYLS